MSGEGGPMRMEAGRGAFDGGRSDGLPPHSTAAIVQAGLDQAAQTLFSAADVPLASAEELRSAVTGPAAKAVFEMRIEQIVRHGHSQENDEMLPLMWLPKQARDHAQIACERIGVTGRDRNLDAAEKSLARCAALCMAGLDRIRLAREALKRAGAPERSS